MRETRITDKYNSGKVWIIRHYNTGHYYINQEIKGKKLNKRFVRRTKKQLAEIGLAA